VKTVNINLPSTKDSFLAVLPSENQSAWSLRRLIGLANPVNPEVKNPEIVTILAAARVSTAWRVIVIVFDADEGRGSL